MSFGEGAGRGSSPTAMKPGSGCGATGTETGTVPNRLTKIDCGARLTVHPVWSIAYVSCSVIWVFGVMSGGTTKLMKSLDYGKDYQYAHDVEGRVADMECLPAGLAGRRYYHPTNEGREKLLAQRMDEISRIKAEKRR